MLVQLICSQKELKIANWGDVLRAIQSNPEGLPRCSFFLFSRLSDVEKPHGWDAELPLHWAISERAPILIIEALLDIFPEGSALFFALLPPHQVRSQRGDMVPSHFGTLLKLLVGKIRILSAWFNF